MKENRRKYLRTKTKNLLQPFAQFFKNEASGGIVLLACTIVALILANSAVSGQYQNILHHHIRLAFIDLSILHWINDGLMAIFFFVVGLEIKREFLFGELKSISATILPILGAIGGMIVPAIIFSIINWGQPTIVGWGVPMATDIAFSLGILALAASNAPRSIAIFLTALAIVDDLGGIIVIALFYSSDISILYLVWGALVFCGVFILNRKNVTNFWMYLLLGIAAWCIFFKAGIHPTIAGVVMGLLIPADKSQSVKKSLLHRLEHRITPWSAWFIMPVFALANAGIPLSSSDFHLIFTPVALGVIAGLFIGKPLGIFGTAYLLFRSKLIKIPEGTNKKQFFSAGCLGGIGFTMSLFIASLAFSEIPEYLTEAKLGIIVASCLSGIAGYTLFKIYGRTSQ